MSETPEIAPSGQGGDERLQRNTTGSLPRPRFSLSQLLITTLLVAFGMGWAVTARRLSVANRELERLRQETGYLAPTDDDQIAAVRLTSDQPMTFRLRVRVPEGQRYRIAYSTLWPASKGDPLWYGAVQMPPGESVVIVRVLKDPRDERWKIATLRRGVDGTRRIATVLPRDQIDIFTGSHDWLKSGIPRESTTHGAVGDTIRLLDERVLVGEGAMMLYGDRPPPSDLVGVFAELQPDQGSL